MGVRIDLRIFRERDGFAQISQDRFATRTINFFERVAVLIFPTNLVMREIAEASPLSNWQPAFS
jgi:hypothetical protein